MAMDPGTMAVVAVTALLAAVAAVAALAAWNRRDGSPRTRLFDEVAGATIFLFDGETLVDATPGARAILAHGPLRTGTAWTQLLAWLAPQIPDAAAALARLPADGRISLSGRVPERGEPIRLMAESRGGLLRIALSDGDAPPSGMASEPLADRALGAELDQLRQVADAAPMPVWREDDAGRITWGNAAYLDQVLRRTEPGASVDWPLPALFPRGPGTAGSEPLRQRLLDGDGGEQWFELRPAPLAEGRLVFALPADRAVRAETSLRAFMQTLAKTFAHLRTGLAIFDEGRQLQLFNPALTDLTGLPPDFLSARPRLSAFLDALRDRSMIPEPRDYRSWHREMTDLESAAASGLYEEVWNLPGGQAFRVTGRPHPDGALALMFEDISTEITRARRFRADLELGQSVIDAMDDAVAVFSQAGQLVMSNAAYAALWGHDPGASLDGGETTAAAICDRWRAMSAPTTVWDRAEDFVTALGPHPGWTDSVRLNDGRRVLCRVARLAGGATLVVFREDETAGTEGTVTFLPRFASMRRSA